LLDELRFAEQKDIVDFINERYDLLKQLIHLKQNSSNKLFNTMPEFDFSAMESESPLLVLYDLVWMRFHAMEEHILNNPQDVEKQWMNSMTNLINPLCLASAISISIIKGYDFQSFLGRYASGQNIPEMKEYLLKLPDLGSEEDLGKFLEFETRYVEALRLLPLELMLPNNEKNNEEVKSKLRVMGLEKLSRANTVLKFRNLSDSLTGCQAKKKAADLD
jgi:hypothetical protein